MLVCITNVTATDTGKFHVDFSTSIGSGQALWHGERPVVDQTYHVEIDIGEELVWGTSIQSIQAQVHRISLHEKKMVLQGVLEALEPDGSAVMRLDNSLVFIQTAGEIPGAGGFVQIIATDIEVYDMNL